MKRSHRRLSGTFQKMFQLPTLPFLSIMLGLMSVMALTTMGLSVARRQEEKKSKAIELVGIPAHFLPLQFRCRKEGLEWKNLDGTPQKTSILDLFALLQKSIKTELPPDAKILKTFLLHLPQINQRLSFHRQQYTILLWVEPDGILTKMALEVVISDLQIPLRVGALPIFETESLSSHAFSQLPSN